MLICPRCGNKEQEQFGTRDEMDKNRPTECFCKECGYNGSEVIFQKKVASTVGGKTNDASDKSETPVDKPLTTKDKMNRKKPEKRIQHTDTEEIRGTVSMSNPFIKTAREFKRSPWGEKMKNISEENMAFPEVSPANRKNNGKVDDDSSINGGVAKEKSGTDSEGGGKQSKGKSDNNFSTYDFNPVDRKEYRSSPKPEDLIPGYKEWKEKEVDTFYDGWVDDHIENSGGQIVGSNTPEKNIMNLDGDDRDKDMGNRELTTERLLEQRHNFNDDYSFTQVASGEMVSKKALQIIESNKRFASISEENTFISKSALELMKKKAELDCVDCEPDGLKKKIKKIASKFPLHSIPV